MSAATCGLALMLHQLHSEETSASSCMESCFCTHKNSSQQRVEPSGWVQGFDVPSQAPEIKARLTVVKDGAGDEGQLGLVLGLAGVQRSSLFACDAATARRSKALWVLQEWNQTRRLTRPEVNRNPCGPT